MKKKRKKILLRKTELFTQINVYDLDFPAQGQPFLSPPAGRRWRIDRGRSRKSRGQRARRGSCRGRGGRASAVRRREAAPGPSVPRYRAQVTPGLLEPRLPGRRLRPLRAAPPGRPHHDPCAGFAERPHSARDGAAALPSAAGGAPRGRGRAMALLPALLLLLLLPLAALAAAAVLLGLPGYDIPPGVNQPAKLRLVLTVLLGTAALVSGGAGGEGVFLRGPAG